MSNLEAELARFEAELATVETTSYYEQPAGDAQIHHYPSHIAAGPSDTYAAPNAPPAQAGPGPQPSMTHTQPMYHQYQAPTDQAATFHGGHGGGMPPGMLPPPPPAAAAAYGMPQQQQQGYAGQAAAGYYPPPPAAAGYAQDPYSVAPTMMGSTLSAAPVINTPPPQSDQEEGKAADNASKPEVKKSGKAMKRHAAGQTWWDPTLSEWPENDFRIFVGDLGNEVNDDVLAKAFQKYPTFAKAKVVRDKRSNKSKGFGFVSFLESGDYAKALREMDGKYIGNRPCKLRKSSWQERAALPSKKHKKQKT